MKTGILTFEQFQGKKDLGSSRIRGHWIVKHWKDAGEDIGDAEIFRYGEHYDVVIYQKAYFVEHAKAFKGIKILDLCDPDWLHWSFRFKEMIEEVDAITCSSMELTKQVSQFTDKPVFFVPDRVDLEGMPEPKIHKGPTKTVAWFGYSHNFPMLDAAMKCIVENNLNLIVVANDVYSPPSAFKIEVSNLPFSPHYLEDIKRADVVINPQYTKGKWKFKSSNKTVIAKAVGMPVANDQNDLEKLLTEVERIQASEEGLKDVKENWDLKLSVIDYKDVIKEIINSKK